MGFLQSILNLAWSERVNGSQYGQPTKIPGHDVIQALIGGILNYVVHDVQVNQDLLKGSSRILDGANLQAYLRGSFSEIKSLGPKWGISNKGFNDINESAIYLVVGAKIDITAAEDQPPEQVYSHEGEIRTKLRNVARAEHDIIFDVTHDRPESRVAPAFSRKDATHQRTSFTAIKITPQIIANVAAFLTVTFANMPDSDQKAQDEERILRPLQVYAAKHNLIGVDVLEKFKMAVNEYLVGNRDVFAQKRETRSIFERGGVDAQHVEGDIRQATKPTSTASADHIQKTIVKTSQLAQKNNGSAEIAGNPKVLDPDADYLAVNTGGFVTITTQDEQAGAELKDQAEAIIAGLREDFTRLVEQPPLVISATHGSERNIMSPGLPDQIDRSIEMFVRITPQLIAKVFKVISSKLASIDDSPQKQEFQQQVMAPLQSYIDGHAQNAHRPR